MDIACLAGVCVSYGLNIGGNYVSSFLFIDIPGLLSSIILEPLLIFNVQWLSQEVLLMLIVLCLIIIFVLGIRLKSYRRDSKDQKTINESLTNRSAQVASLNENINRFISIVSHDLRSPLNSISAISELLAMDAEKIPPEEIRKYADNVHDLTMRINNLVNNMRDVNRIEMGEVSFNLKSVDTTKIAKEAYDSLKVLGDKKSITTTLNIEDSIPNIRADQDALKRVLENLINNAYKFSGEGSTVEIQAEYLTEEGKVSISVRDQGPGFTKEDRKKLYSKFSQLSATPTAGEKTTGLGLFIVQELVERMNGTIELDSTPGEGSTFSVILEEA